MGSEECYEKDEECSSRKMIEEAHLDYIYTQNRKPWISSVQLNGHLGSNAEY